MWRLLLTVGMLVYAGVYGPVGFDHNDGGFILGLAYQVAQGASLYTDVIYVRPPVTPILHSVVFWGPLSYAPVLADRFIFFLQMGLCSWLSARMAGGMCGWRDAWTAGVAAAGFMFSVHGFPAMGWHTVDGVFFSVLALYCLWRGLDGRRVHLGMAGIFALAAAGSKQPFYVVLPLLVSLAIWLRARPSMLVLLLVPAAAMLSLGLGWLSSRGELDAFLGAVSAQTSLQDLLDAGVWAYVDDLKAKYGAAVFLAVGVALAVARRESKASGHRTLAAALLLGVVMASLILLARIYWRAESWLHPSSVFDVIFLATLVCTLTMIGQERSDFWPWMAAMHVIAWAASISWGYQTVSLYMMPPILVIAYWLGRHMVDWRGARYVLVGLLPCMAWVFFAAHQFTYSLEGPSSRVASVKDLGKLNASFRFIRVTEPIYQDYAQLKFLKQQYPGPFVTLPNMPASHLLTNEPNPVGIDWPLNAEVGRFTASIEDRLTQRVSYAFIRRGGQPDPSRNDKFGSAVTTFVQDHWPRLATVGSFDIHRNPRFADGFIGNH
ncbi:MAG: hypothetical protein QM742_11730 [Aquabacterium sp.]